MMEQTSNNEPLGNEVTALDDKALEGVSGGVSIDREFCVGCELCKEYCPIDAIDMVDGYAVIDQAACIQCEYCLNFCPTGAISS